MPQPRTPKKPVTLADLSPDDRELLLAEARAAGGEQDNADVEHRTAAIRALMEDRDHARGCPATRVEAYGATRPARPTEGIPAQMVTVARCIDCGGSVVLAQSYEQTIAQIDSETREEATA